MLKKVEISIENHLYEFYKKVGEQAGGIKPEKVIADVLFKLAGELSLNALSKNSQAK